MIHGGFCLGNGDAVNRFRSVTFFLAANGVYMRVRKRKGLNFLALFTRLMRIGTSSNGPITVAKAWSELMHVYLQTGCTQ